MQVFARKSPAKELSEGDGTGRSPVREWHRSCK